MANIFAEKHDFTFFRNDDVAYEIPVVDSNNNPFDWSGYSSPLSEMRLNYDDPDPIAAFTIVLSTGIIKLSLSKTVTGQIDPGSYLYDIQMILPDLRSQTLITGVITVKPDVTLL